MSTKNKSRYTSIREVLLRKEKLMRIKVSIIILLCLLALTYRAYGASITDLYILNEYQESVLINSIYYAETYGKEEYKFILAAIAWRESSFGLEVINFDDGQYGAYCPFQILVDTALKREGYEPTNQNVAIISAYLLSDFEYCITHAIKELDYWRYKRKRSLSAAIASYRTGNKGLNNDGRHYLSDIQNRVKLIKEYWRNHK